MALPMGPDMMPPPMPGAPMAPPMPPPGASPMPPNVTPITSAPSAPKRTKREESIRRRREAATRARESYAASHKFSLSGISDNSDHRDLTNTIRQLFQDARGAKRPLMSRWNTNYLYFRNRVNAASMPRSGDRSTPLVPEIFPIVASKVGWKIDRRIRTTISSSAIPNTPYWTDTSDLAADLAAVMDATCQVNQEEAEYIKAIWDSELYGTGILKTTWHPDLAGGLGDAMSTRVDPYTFYPDPQARGMYDANHFLEVRTMSLQEADRRWPGSGKKLREDPFVDAAEEARDQLDNSGTFPRANPGAITPGHIPSYGMVGGGFMSATQDPGVTIIEAWLRTHDTISDDSAPFGYRIEETWRVVVVAGNTVLMDEPATNLWSHGRHPYSRLVPMDIGEFWGFSTVELLIPTQKSINRLLAAFQTNVELTGNPILVDESRAGVSRSQVTNKPGSRITTGAGGKVDWMKPPQTNQQQMELVRYMLQRMEAVSGLAAVTRGGSPPGRNAQGVMDSLQEAAFVRIRMELKEFEFCLTDAGKLKANLIVENYTEPRTMAIIGPDGAKKMLSLAERHFLIPTMDGEIPLEYNLLVDAGATEHTSRKVREDTAMGLANMGMFDARATLEALEIPGRAEILKRVEAQQQMAAAQGQQQK